ncbi:ankyrin repeat domain-containing protein [Maribacter arenosus]|uniref:Ankyrin repeat domain-containing protein n=1 Tax=Maribacter arenosus TaxID=1854708 RepID=A0ABR7VK81_9FLAO|nr:ankyrin repeat domain-containing protein [Maribacter arenosus]MBD0852572.1 ankyrin repeat domain-containing protein [Maribacter arenosus]
MERSDFLISVIDMNFEKAKQIIHDGIDINQCDSNGWTALHFAAQNNDIRIGKLLIDKGASLDLQDKYGNSPLWRATFTSNGKGDFISLLLANGADRNLKNLNDISPVELAKTIANYDILRFYK